MKKEQQAYYVDKILDILSDMKFSEAYKILEQVYNRIDEYVLIEIESARSKE